MSIIIVILTLSLIAVCCVVGIVHVALWIINGLIYLLRGICRTVKSIFV